MPNDLLIAPNPEEIPRSATSFEFRWGAAGIVLKTKATWPLNHRLR